MDDSQLKNIRNIHVIQKGEYGKAQRYFKIKIELFSGGMLPLSAENYGLKNHVDVVAKELRELLEANSSFIPINDWHR